MEAIYANQNVSKMQIWWLIKMQCEQIDQRKVWVHILILNMIMESREGEEVDLKCSISSPTINLVFTFICHRPPINPFSVHQLSSFIPEMSPSRLVSCIAT